MSQALLDKARTAMGKGIQYSLGCGGYFPADDVPARTVTRKKNGKAISGLFCDCSGFVSWCVGLSRRTTIVKGLWGISTVSIYRDATTHQKYFVALGKAGKNKLPFEPIPGDLIVYPDANGKQGHVAILVSYEEKTIIDCSSSQNGITERKCPPSVWSKGVVVRYVFQQV